MYKVSSLLLLIVLFAGCSGSSEPKVPEEIATLEKLTMVSAEGAGETSIKFNREAVFKSTNDELIGDIASVAVGNKRRVFIADNDRNIIHVFADAGHYLGRVGSEGKGPGEFGNISAIRTEGQYLYALDWGQRRVNVFELESLELSHTIPLLREDQNIKELSGRYPSIYFPRKDGKLLVRFSQPFSMNNLEEKRNNLYYLIDSEGNVNPEKIMQQKSGEVLTDRSGNSFMVMSSPYGGRTLLTTGIDDRIYAAWNKDFLIKVYKPDGSYERSYYMPYTKSPLDMGEVLKDYEGERQRKMIRNADAPDTWPALNSLEVDDRGRMWISTITDDRKTFDWWVINEEGELLARFTWPQNRQLISVKGDYLYTEETDKKTGLEQVVRYRVEI